MTCKSNFKIIFLVLFFQSVALATEDSPQTFVFEGRAYDVSDNPLTDASVDFNFKIWNPAKSCILYEETQTAVNLNTSSGFFALEVGSKIVGGGKRSGNDPGLAMSQVFQNLTVVSGKTAGGAACNYTGAAGEKRVLVATMTPSGGVADVIPDIPITSVPQALVAESLQGILPNGFIQVTGNVTQANMATLTGTGDASALHHHDGRYLQSGATANLGNNSYVSGSFGIGTSAPSTDLGFGGNADRTIGVGRNTTTDGSDLTVSSGGALSGGTNLSGGNLVLSSGISTGSGSSSIEFKTTTAGGAGTADNNPTTKMTILGNGNVGISNTNPGALLDLGTAGSKLGTMRFEGSTSGYVQIQPAVAAGSWTWTLPATDGANGEVLTTDGNGVTSWAAASGSDNLGNHTATTNIQLGTNWLSGDGGSEGVYVGSTGNVGIGNSSPGALLDVGVAGATLGVIRLEGNTSGYAALRPTAAAGDVTITLPATTGTVALTGNKLSTFAATTSAELAGVISDETGSGALVFGTSPTLTTPVLGAATGTSLDLGAAGSVLGTLKLEGNTSGYVQIQSAAAAGSWTWTLPADDGTNGQVLTTNGSGVTSWAAAGTSSQWTTTGSDIYYNSGKVGIGNSAPGSPLHVTSTAATGIYADASGGTTAIYGLGGTTGVKGEGGAAGFGVYGITTAGIAVRGVSAGAGTGGYFSSTTGYGLIVDTGNVGIANTAPGALLDIGTAGTTKGTMRLEGNTSGYVQVQPAAAAGSWTWTLPADDGTNGQVLQTDGNGVTTWASAGGITGLTAGRVPYAASATTVADSANFVWDNTNNRVGINTTPSYSLHTKGTFRAESTSSASAYVSYDGATAPVFSVNATTGNGVYVYWMSNGGASTFAGWTVDSTGLTLKNNSDGSGLATVLTILENAGATNGYVGIGDSSPDTTLKVTGSLCVKSDGNNCAGSTAGTIYAGNTTVQSADYAEYFLAETKLQKGSVVGLNSVTGLARGYQPGDKLLGVVSTNPGVVGNSDIQDQLSVLVALMGQVPFRSNQTKIDDGIVKTLDGKPLGYLLSNGNVYVNISSTGYEKEILFLNSENEVKAKEIENLKSANTQLKTEVTIMKQYLCQKDPTASICKGL